MSTLALPEIQPIDPIGRRRRWSPWQVWGVLLLAPYVLVFLVFVVYPVAYGFWLARDPQSYVQLFADPVFGGAVVNTLLFLLVGINVKMLVALFLSGFFVNPRDVVTILVR